MYNCVRKLEREEGLWLRKVLLVPSGDMVDGGLGHATRCRCDRAIELWRRKKYDLIVASGGTIVCKGEKIPAATIMKKYLVEKGVPDEAIMEETGAVDSTENIHLALAKLRRKFGGEKFQIDIDSWWQHALRLWASALLGFGTFMGIRLAWYRVSPQYCVMELAMFAYTIYDPKGVKPFAQNLRLKRRSP